MPKHMNRKRLFFVDTPDEDDKGSGKTFTQDEVNALIAREKSEAKRAGAKTSAETISTQLKNAGFGDDAKLEDILALAKSKTDADDALKSEAEKAKDAADAAKTEANKILAEAKQERFEAKVERLLTDASNVKIARAGLAAYDITAESTDDEVTEAIKSLKTDAPGLFGTVKPGNTDTGSSRKQTTTTSARERAEEYAKARNWKK